MLEGSAGPLALSLMQNFILNTDLKMVRQESEMELDEHIALKLFRVSTFLSSHNFSTFFFHPCFVVQALLHIEERTYWAVEAWAKEEFHQKEAANTCARHEKITQQLRGLLYQSATERLL